MEEPSSSKIEECFNIHHLNLLDLPIETLESILGNLPVRDICVDIRKACRRLYSVTHTNAFWVGYLKNQFDYEPIPSTVDAEPWRRAVAISKERHRWVRDSCLMRFKTSTQHYATVDTLKLHETRAGDRFAISGARDRSIMLWNIRNVVEYPDDIKSWNITVNEAHLGWIWSVCVSNNDKHVFSCGFDSLLKQWEICEDRFVAINKGKTAGIPMRCITEGDIVYCSTNKMGMFLADSRIGLNPQQNISGLDGHILSSLVSRPESDYVFTASSEEGKVFCVDKRTLRVIKKTVGMGKCTSLELTQDHLVASLRSGVIRFLNPHTMKSEYAIKSDAPSEHNSPNPTCISDGSIIYGAAYHLFVYSPGKSPKILAKLDTKEMIITVDYNNGDLACGMGEGHVRFWPRENQNWPLNSN